MIEKSKLQEEFDDRLFKLLEDTHRAGLPFYDILKRYLDMLQTLIIQVDAEVWLNKK